MLAVWRGSRRGGPAALAVAARDILVPEEEDETIGDDGDVGHELDRHAARI
jgi:hypothetical protein